MKSVTIQRKPKHKVLGEVEFSVECPQAETFAEGVNWAGGEAKVLEVLNWAAMTKLKSNINSRAANASETETTEVFLTAVQDLAAKAVPTAGRVGPTRKEKLDFAEEIQKRKASGQALSGEQLLQLAEQYGLQ